MRGLETEHMISGPMKGLEKALGGDNIYFAFNRHTSQLLRVNSVKIKTQNNPNLPKINRLHRSPVHQEAWFPGGDNIQQQMDMATESA